MPGEVEREYEQRLAARRALADALGRRDRALSNLRLACFALIIGVAWLAFGAGLLSGWLTLLPALAFVGLLVHHDRVLHDLDTASLAVSWYEHGLARVQDRWAGMGPAGRAFAHDGHPYSGDLDLFGHGSLYQLLCTARTRAGEECLAAWLTASASPLEVRSRQQAVAELAPRLDLREDMAVLGGQGSSEVDPRALAEWGAAAGSRPPLALRAAAAALAVLAVVGAVLWSTGLGLLPLGGVVLAEIAFGAAVAKQVRTTLGGVEAPARHLVLLSAIVARWQRESLEAPLLRHLLGDLRPAGVSAAERIIRLSRLVDAVHMAGNPFIAPFAALLLWRAHFAFAIENWRVENGPEVAGWLRAVGELEALASLSAYAHEHPGDVFPTVADAGCSFQAEGLAHPFLPAARAIANEVSLGEESRVLIVSGSNMSGKSTLLRAVGVNAVLALAGAPVRARRLQLSSVQVAASMRAADSLQAGVSHFYAEITRLHQVVALAEQGPVLFLLDEILHGTNSHDRLIGAAAIVRALARHGAVGLVTTHDLALARLAEEDALHAANVHFEDHLEDGKMSFDYRLRPGVVQKSNAIELMRAVGLPV